MRKSAAAIAFTATFAFLTLPTSAADSPAAPSSGTPSSLAAVFTERMNEYPSLWQKDPRGDFKGDGSLFCAPVATSNGLMWLVEHGYPGLLPDPTMPRRSMNERALAQVALVRAFTADKYAPMRENSGTSLSWIGRGVRRYISDRGYRVTQCEERAVECDGATPELPSVAAPGRAARPAYRLADIKAALKDGAVVVLSLGRYRAKPEDPQTYARYGGHAVTLVGWGQAASGAPDPDVLIVHDPSRTRGRTWPNTFLRTTPISHGRVKRRDGSLLELTGSRYEVGGAESTNDGHIVLLDSALILRLASPSSAAVPMPVPDAPSG